MADVPEQSQQYRLRGPYGRMVQDAESKAWRTVMYEKGAMITPSAEELKAHPDLFEEWPPPGTVLEPPPPPTEPPPDETTSVRSRR